MRHNPRNRHSKFKSILRGPGQKCCSPLPANLFIVTITTAIALYYCIQACHCNRDQNQLAAANKTSDQLIRTPAAEATMDTSNSTNSLHRTDFDDRQASPTPDPNEATSSQQPHQSTSGGSLTQTPEASADHNHPHQRQDSLHADEQEVELRQHSKKRHKPATSSSPHMRIYRIRAAGANGHFGSSPLQVRHLGQASDQDARAVSSASQPTSQDEPAEAVGDSLPPHFGDRHQPQQPQQPPAGTFRLARVIGATKTKVKPPGSGGVANCARQANDAETTAAEASSISASSQTLRLSNKTAAANNWPASIVGQPRQWPRQQVAPAADATSGGSLVDQQQVVGAERQKEPENEREQGQGRGEQAQAQVPIDNQVERVQAARESTIMSLIDEFDSKISTNKTQAQLSCDSGEMIIRLNFTEPFKGIVYPDHNRLSPCRFFGDGHLNYELRLPLRGCGTKQVAQRVFVNDVTVRFHKTLELEEDEVKTLICRYPPPTEAGNQLGSGSSDNNSQQREREQAGGAGAAVKGLVHELEPATYSGANRTLEPFELVDPISGKPTNRFGDPLGALVAPSSGSHGRHQSSALPGKGLDAYYQQQQEILGGNTINQRQRLNLLDRQRHASLATVPPPILTNSRLFDPLTDSSSSGNQTTGVGFFDRLTSVELLFLISALMFLVLLALGLLASYYCFWWRRRRARRGLDSPAVAGRGALMRHKRRYFNAPLHSVTGSQRDTRVPAPTGSVFSPTLRPAAHQHQYLAPTTPSSSQHQLLQSQYQARPALYYHHYLQQQQQQMGAPSSPDDSDISGRVLLPSSGRGGRSMSRPPPLRRPLGPTEDTTSAAPYDTSLLRRQNNNHYKSAALLSPLQSGSSVLGRRSEQSMAAAAYGSSTLGRRAGDEPSGYFSTNLRSSIGLNSHRNNNRQQAPGRVQVLPPAATGATNSTTLGRGVSACQPLLKLAGTPPQSNEDDHEDDGDNEPLVYANQQYIGAPPNQQRMWQQTKPVQQLGRMCGGELLAWHRHQDQLDRLREERGQERLQVRSGPVVVSDAAGLTYGKQRLRCGDDSGDAGQNQLHRKHWQRQMVPLQTGTDEGRDDKQTASASRRLVNVECSSPSLTSPSDGSELELNNNGSANVQADDAFKQPRLILQSIEDRFVTNFIEIHEQEYKKYDTTRPISWAEWASKQPARMNSTTTQSADRAGAASSGDRLGGNESGDSSEDSRSVAADGGDQQEELQSSQLQSSATNCLRSLTELDVNFAKSLPRRQSRPTTNQSEPSGVANTTSQQRVATGPNQPSVVIGSVPVVKVSSPPTPDLVISPDYNFGRFKLVGPSRQSAVRTNGDSAADRGIKKTSSGNSGASPKSPSESHESISYV